MITDKTQMLIHVIEFNLLNSKLQQLAIINQGLNHAVLKMKNCENCNEGGCEVDKATDEEGVQQNSALVDECLQNDHKLWNLKDD